MKIAWRRADDWMNRHWLRVLAAGTVMCLTFLIGFNRWASQKQINFLTDFSVDVTNLAIEIRATLYSLYDAQKRTLSRLEDHELAIAALQAEDKDAEEIKQLLASIKATRNEVMAEWEALKKSQTDRLQESVADLDAARRRMDDQIRSRFDTESGKMLGFFGIVAALFLGSGLLVVFGRKSGSESAG